MQIAKLDFGKGDRNPVDDVGFFKKGEQGKAVAIKGSEVS